jgi:hypothetical protein
MRSARDDRGSFTMKIHKSLITIIVLVPFLFIGCASLRRNGDKISQERSVGEFDGVTLSGIGSVNIHFSDDYRVVVTTDSNIQDFVTTVTTNNTLDVDLTRSVQDARVTVDVYLPALERVNLKGVGSFRIDDGNATDLEIRHSGVGSVNMKNYRVENVTVMGGGVGDIEIWAVNTLNGKWSGVGTIHYKGNPRFGMDFSGVGGFNRIK